MTSLKLPISGSLPGDPMSLIFTYSQWPQKVFGHLSNNINVIELDKEMPKLSCAFLCITNVIFFIYFLEQYIKLSFIQYSFKLLYSNRKSNIVNVAKLN